MRVVPFHIRHIANPDYATGRTKSLVRPRAMWGLISCGEHICHSPMAKIYRHAGAISRHTATSISSFSVSTSPCGLILLPCGLILLPCDVYWANPVRRVANGGCKATLQVTASDFAIIAVRPADSTTLRIDSAWLRAFSC